MRLFNKLNTTNLMLKRTLFLFLLTIFMSAAQAQYHHAGIGLGNGRNFPENTYRGMMSITQYPMITLDGKQEQLPPGAKIMDTNNRITHPGMLGNQPHVVNYIRSDNGTLNTIWLITEAEQKERLPVANPSWWRKLLGLEK